MSRVSGAVAQAAAAPAAMEPGDEVLEDSNNNTSLVDRERATEAAGETSHSHNSPAVREIHKNSWLKRMPCVDKWGGKFPKTQKLEKFWVVFCVHDDKAAFLEFYENRRSAYSHMPLSSISLSNCLHISPTIVAHGNDHEFVITLESQVIRLAASTNDQMLEWMDTLTTKLRELRVLEPKDNLYSKEPITVRPMSQSIAASSTSDLLLRDDISRLSLRDPNSPLPPVPSTVTAVPPPPPDPPETSSVNSAVVYIRNPPSAFHSSAHSSSTSLSVTSSTLLDGAAVSRTLSQSVPESVFNFDVPEPTARPVSGSTSSQGSVSPVPSPTEPETPVVTSAPSLLYEPLFCTSSPSVSIGVRNPSYENPPQRHIVCKPTPALPPRPINNLHRASVPGDMSQNGVTAAAAVRTNLGNLSSTSDPALNASSSQPCISHPAPSSSVLSRIRSQVEPVSSAPERTAHASGSERTVQNGLRQSSSSKNGTIPVDENGKPISLREAQVQKLQSEISHKSGVRLLLRKKDCLNAIAFVECFNHIWVAGWNQKEHPLLHNTFHVGDRVLSISGQRISSVQDAHKAVKQQPTTVEFIVRRVPYGKIFAIRREYEGQDLGIVREGGTAEIKDIKPSGLAARQGLPLKATSLDGNSLCNWFLTEINHRPLNLFFKDSEIQDRLNAVGLDISLLVQPIELVKGFKKQLKMIRGYKDYIVQ